MGPPLFYLAERGLRRAIDNHPYTITAGFIQERQYVARLALYRFVNSEFIVKSYEHFVLFAFCVNILQIACFNFINIALFSF